MPKRKISVKYLFMVLFMLICINAPFAGIVVKAYSDISTMSDQVFFGEWNGVAWTTQGKINYGYSSGLTSVENAVKSGNYATAKSELLAYFKNRTIRTAPVFSSESRNTDVADLACDNILTGLEDQYLNSITLDNTYQTVSADVTGTVQAAMDTGGDISFLLMSRYKELIGSTFYSIEQSTNKPTLEVVADGQTINFTANKDTYIRGGMYGDSNYGTESSLEIKDSGVPFDNYTRRAYINFDISSITGDITSAKLKLYGKHLDTSGTRVVLIYRVGDTTWGENSLTWNTTKGMTFSWQGIADGPDWNQPSYGADSVYINIIARFGFLSTITQEYTVTSYEYYANNGIRLMMDFINDKENNGDYPTSLDVGKRAKCWVQVYHYLVDSSSMDSEANTAILKYFWRMANYLATNPEAYHPASNWATQETDGLYRTVVYFPEFNDSAEWLDLAKTRLDFLATSLLNIDGSYVEASSTYTGLSLSILANVKGFAEINGQSLNPAFDVGVKKLARYYMEMMLPDGWDPQFGDGDYADDKPCLLSVGQTYNDDQLKYVGSGGTSGVAPSYKSTAYIGSVKNSNIAFMRSGWTANDLYLNIHAGAGSHGHRDLLAATAYAYGQRLIVDVGRYSYDPNSSIGNWLRYSTEAHNTVEINDTAQSNASQTVKAWVTNNAYDLFEGSSTAYSGFTHVRDVLFIKDKYWIVSDNITGGTATNKYQQTWHMLPDAAATLDGTTKKVSAHFNGSANIQIVPADPADLTASLDDGYYSKAYLSVSNAKYASYVKNVSDDASFDTILYPTATSDTGRNVKVTRLETNPGVSATVATALKIEQDYGHNGDMGYYYLSHENRASTARSFDIYNYDGKMAYVETDYAGNRKSALVKSGKTLKQNSTNLIYSLYEFNDLGVKWDGTTLEISGAELKTDTNTATAIAIYAPSVTTVKLNGTTVSYTRSGDYIYAVKPMKLFYDAQNDFSSMQGQFGWYNQKYDGSTYTNLPVWDAGQLRWVNTGGANPVIAGAYQTTGSSDDSVRKWVAPCSGIVTFEGRVYSKDAYATGDGTRVKILKNSSNVWPLSGWQSLARDDRTGYQYRETITVNQGDAIYLIVNNGGNGNATNDCVRFYCNITLFPGATIFADDFEDGNANGWTPLTAGRWTVGTDTGDYSYYINTTDYQPLSGERLGEYSLINGSNYTNFEMTLKAKPGDSVSTNATADLAIVFNYQNSNNYYYVMFNNTPEYIQIYKVKNGVRQLIICSDGMTDWITDNDYHFIKLRRESSTGRIMVWYDSSIILDGYDKEFNGGQIGIGSYNDSAHFDDIAVVKVD